MDEDGISINSSNPLSISASSSAVSTIFDNRKVVASAGTAEPLAGSATPFTRCTVQAESDNTGDVVIGASTVVASSATRRGISLVSGSAYTFTSPFDLASIYIDSEVTGEGVTYFCQN